MAETASIVVTIRAQETGSNVDNSAEVNAVKKGDVNGSEADGSGKAAFAMFAKQIGEAALNEVLAWVEYEWGKEMRLNDDYIGQRNMRIAKQCVSKTIGYASATMTGAMMGSAAGPVGAAVGAVIGFAGAAASTVRENLQAMEQQDIMLRQMNAQLNYTRQRAGWSLEAASIGEDL